MKEKQMRTPALTQGWQFTPEEYQRAHKEHRLLTAQIETSNVCNLNCPYCFREDDAISQKRAKKDELTLAERLLLIDKLCALGTRTINIIGAGEPTIDPYLMSMLVRIADNGATPVLFTNGIRITENLAKQLLDIGAVPIIKVNSFRPELQDRMVGAKGYTQRRDEVLSLLLSLGFNESDGTGATRLGIDTVLCRENMREAIGIFTFARENGIMPLMKTFIPVGRSLHLSDWELSLSEYLCIAREARDLDYQWYGIWYDNLLPYLGGVRCTQYGSCALYVTIDGDITVCPGTVGTAKLGNVRNPEALDNALQQIWSLGSNARGSCKPRSLYYKKISRTQQKNAVDEE